MVMSFHSRQKKCLVRPEVTFNEINLMYTTETKFWGVYIMEKVKCNTYVQSLANKLIKTPFMIKPLKEIMCPFMVCNIYFSKVPVTFTVWNTVLGGDKDNSNKKTFIIQKR